MLLLRGKVFGECFIRDNRDIIDLFYALFIDYLVGRLKNLDGLFVI